MRIAGGLFSDSRSGAHLGLDSSRQRLTFACSLHDLASKARRKRIGSRNDSVFPDPVPEVTTIFFSFEWQRKESSSLELDDL